MKSHSSRNCPPNTAMFKKILLAQAAWCTAISLYMAHKGAWLPYCYRDRFTAAALNLIQGRGFGQNDFTASLQPAYALFLAGIWKVLPLWMGWIPIRVAQVLLMTTSIWLISEVVRDLWGKRTQKIYVTLVCLSPVVGAISMQIREASLAIFFFSLFTYYWFESRYPNPVGLGILMGLTVLTLPSFGLFFLVLMLMRGWRKTWLVGLVAFCVVVPWCVRQYVVFDRIIPVRADFGFNFWIGNHDRATGTDSVVGDMQSEEVPPGMQKALRGMPEVDKYRYYFKQGLNWAVRNPLKWAVLRVKCFVYFWVGRRVFTPSRTAWDANFIWLDLFMLMTATFGLLWERLGMFPKMTYFILLFTVFPLIYVMSDASYLVRFRLPLDLFLWMFSAYALEEIWRML